MLTFTHARTHTHTQHPATNHFLSFLRELRAVLRDGSRPFQPVPSVDRELLNLEEEIRHCLPPMDKSNVREGGGGGGGRRGRGREGEEERGERSLGGKFIILS